MPSTLQDLEARRDAILLEIARTGDMRAGSISENYRKCGKSSCRCAQPDDPGHGPYYAYTWKEDGKTRTAEPPARSRARPPAAPGRALPLLPGPQPGARQRERGDLRPAVPGR
jgi:hypothetical protein